MLRSIPHNRVDTTSIRRYTLAVDRALYGHPSPSNGHTISGVLINI